MRSHQENQRKSESHRPQKSSQNIANGPLTVREPTIHFGLNGFMKTTLSVNAFDQRNLGPNFPL